GIAVGTANRHEILNRCLTAAVGSCSVARDAHWIVLDDSFESTRPLNREIVHLWGRLGLKLSYVDRDVEEDIANSFPGSTLRGYFAQLVTRSAACRVPGGRNLALLTA